MSALLGSLGSGRAMAESRFSEVFVFFTLSVAEIPPGEIDPVQVETVLHSGVRGRVKFPSLNTVAERELAGQLVIAQGVEVHVSVGAAPLAHEGHFVRVVSSSVDASLVGRVFRVSGMPQAGQTTAHRFPVREE